MNLEELSRRFVEGFDSQNQPLAEDCVAEMRRYFEGEGYVFFASYLASVSAVINEFYDGYASRVLSLVTREFSGLLEKVGSRDGESFAHELLTLAREQVGEPSYATDPLATAREIRNRNY